MLGYRVPAPHAGFLVNRRSGPTVFEPPGAHRRWLLPPRLTEVPPAPAHLAHGPASQSERQLARVGPSQSPTPAAAAFQHASRTRHAGHRTPKDTFMTSRYPPLPDIADRRAVRSG
ncbi:hypothetical protein Stsp02_32030 [Streptomyces sp. NBRC 14336]|nr:hypothetical protein Stsp02_32030 [Streptomyces sp. NBRC 14336]